MSNIQVILFVFIILSTIFTIRSKYFGPSGHFYLFKPMTMIWIILIAFLGDNYGAGLYKYLILLGLIVCLLGDILLMLRRRYFLYGLICFLLGHLSYLHAFTFEMGFGFSSWLTILCFFYGLIIYGILYNHLGSLRIPIFIYILAILLMVIQSWERWLTTGENHVLIAAIGATLFMISDTLLALERFRKPFKSAQIFILSLYFLGQSCIAFST